MIYTLAKKVSLLDLLFVSTVVLMECLGVDFRVNLPTEYRELVRMSLITCVSATLVLSSDLSWMRTPNENGAKIYVLPSAYERFQKCVRDDQHHSYHKFTLCYTRKALLYAAILVQMTTTSVCLRALWSCLLCFTYHISNIASVLFIVNAKDSECTREGPCKSPYLVTS